MSFNTSPPASFWIISVLLLLWSLMGDAAYLMQVTADLDQMATTDPETARIFAAMPTWVWSAYAIAVWVGTLGVVALLLRRRVAVPLFIVSLIGVIVQFGYTFAGTDILARKGASTAIFPLVIIAIGLFEIWWSRRCAASSHLR